MELKYITKAQTHGGSLASTIPKEIMKALELKKGESIIWYLKPTGEDWEVRIKKLEI